MARKCNFAHLEFLISLHVLWTRDDYPLHPPPDGAPAEKALQRKEGCDDGRSSSPDSVMIDTDVAVVL